MLVFDHQQHEDRNLLSEMTLLPAGWLEPPPPRNRLLQRLTVAIRRSRTPRLSVHRPARHFHGCAWLAPRRKDESCPLRRPMPTSRMASAKTNRPTPRNGAYSGTSSGHPLSHSAGAHAAIGSLDSLRPLP